MSKIVVLDAATLMQNDLSLNALEKFGSVKIYERTPKDKVIERLQNAEIAVTNKTIIDASVIDACSNLKYIAILATGYNVVDCEYARSKGIPVSNVPAYSTVSVVQHTFALILELCSQVGAHSQTVAKGDWVKSQDFCYCVAKLTEISNKTLGIVGYGNIGKVVAKVAKAFGLNVLVHNRTPFDGSVSLEELLQKSDIISLHCPLTRDNEKMINAKTLALMKENAILINTARGALIDEKALADALKSGKISGAGLDVLSKEPPNSDNPLLGLPNCIITPHIAWATLEARTRLLNVTLDNIQGYIDNKPVNVVN